MTLLLSGMLSAARLRRNPAHKTKNRGQHQIIPYRSWWRSLIKISTNTKHVDIIIAYEYQYFGWKNWSSSKAEKEKIWVCACGADVYGHLIREPRGSPPRNKQGFPQSIEGMRVGGMLYCTVRLTLLFCSVLCRLTLTARKTRQVQGTCSGKNSGSTSK